MTSRGPGLVVVAALCICLGCAGEDRAAAPATPGVRSRATSPAGSAPEPTVAPTGPGGISLSEAEDLDVLTGDYDALLVGPQDVREADGCLVADVEIRNVGSADDRYELSARQSGVRLVPETLAVADGGSAPFEVHVCDESVETVVIAVSEGGGEVVAELDLTDDLRDTP